MYVWTCRIFQILKLSITNLPVEAFVYRLGPYGNNDMQIKWCYK